LAGEVFPSNLISLLARVFLFLAGGAPSVFLLATLSLDSSPFAFFPLPFFFFFSSALSCSSSSSESSYVFLLAAATVVWLFLKGALETSLPPVANLLLDSFLAVAFLALAFFAAFSPSLSSSSESDSSSYLTNLF
jgi:hypothetical protein